MEHRRFCFDLVGNEQCAKARAQVDCKAFDRRSQVHREDIDREEIYRKKIDREEIDRGEIDCEKIDREKIDCEKSKLETVSCEEVFDDGFDTRKIGERKSDSIECTQVARETLERKASYRRRCEGIARQRCTQAAKHRVAFTKQHDPVAIIECPRTRTRR